MNKTNLLLILFVVLSLNAYSSSFIEECSKNNVTVEFRLNQYDVERSNSLMASKSAILNKDASTIHFQDSKWEVQFDYSETTEGYLDVEVIFKCLEGALNNASLSIDLISHLWSTDNYVLMPGAVYNGNRYPFVRTDYPPFVHEFKQLGPGKSILISDQPKLNYKEGTSRIQERSGSMSIPAIGYHSPSQEKGLFMWFDQKTYLGDYGVNIEEASNRDKAIISLTAPVVRERFKYQNFAMEGKSTDLPANFSTGDSVVIAFQLSLFESENIQTLFNQFSDVQKSILQEALIDPIMPLSIAYEAVKEKYNRANWIEKGEKGYYATQTTSDMFQLSWIGGLITLLPLLQDGDSITQDRVYQNLEWFFTDKNSSTPSNYLPDRIKNDIQTTNLDYKPIGKLYPLVLARRNAEAAYYLFEIFEELSEKNKEVPEQWKSRTIAAANAQYVTWKKYGELGQFINIETGEIVVGNSTSAGILPATLCKVFQLTGDSTYINKAVDIANYFYDNFIVKGISCGGPADALQSIDSESSYGLLVGLTELYKNTGQKVWLDRSMELANQFATWVVAYNFEFPEESLHHKLKVQTVGTVIANTQNKHTAPGICTHSGRALLDLYRFTGDNYYLDLLRLIAKTLPQYLSTKDRPIACLEEGWMSERINMTDWLEGIGEINCQSNWSEVALLLTYAELPGIYVDIDNVRVVSLDHVEAILLKNTKKYLILELYNPTKHDAQVKLLAESAISSTNVHEDSEKLMSTITVQAGNKVTYKISK